MQPDTWGELIARFLIDLARNGASPETVKQRRRQLVRAGRDLGGDPREVTREVLADWLDSHGWLDSTMKSHRAAVRSFYGWLVDVDEIAVSPAARLRVVRDAQEGPRRLPASDIAVAWTQHARDPRVRLMGKLGARLGMRRGEISRADREDLFRDLLGWSMLVKGKGGRRRFVPVPDDLAAEIQTYPPGPLFPGKINGRLSPAWVGTLLSRAMPEGQTAHMLRHRRATKAFDETGDLRVVQELLGHASIATTQVYVHRTARQLRRAVGGSL
ncbi:MAG TPA: tyrosine-type recombinase/integrase [Solirubrobacter sp.]|nr:tyrosine-type recombinase/integrase [Solirubrobacter sp.]